MQRPRLSAALIGAVLLSHVRAQDDTEELDAEFAGKRAVALAAAGSIHRWVEGFIGGRIAPKGEVRFARSSPVTYLRHALNGGVLKRPTRARKTTHYSVLHRIVGVAERYPCREVAEAFLALSAAGYSRDLYSPDTRMVRDVGHFALRRIGDATLWDHILGVATGRIDDSLVPELREGEVPVVDGEGDRKVELEDTARVMRQVAAVRLLGVGKSPVFRVALEKCLADADPRVRFAAAETFGRLRDLRYLYTLTGRAAKESHPLVVMALIDAVERTLKRWQKEVSISRGLNVVRGLLPILGKRGWRNDMTIVRMVRRYPVKASVPALISLMRAAQAELDPLLEAVNEKASPVLADEIFQTLRQVTGALLPPDPNRWQAFWETEKERLQLVAPYRNKRATGGRTTAAFFGIPVIGREVVFVIDTSGSMKEPVGRGTVVKPRKNDGKAPPVLTRLAAAKEQMLKAAQGIPKSTQFHLVTFSGEVRVWNKKPIRAGERSYRALTETLGRIDAQGGTNVWAALLHALGATQIRYGQQIEAGVEEIFAPSDGEPSAGEVKNPAEILRAVSELNRFRKIRINTVFTGVGKGAEFMRKLAAQNYGVFVRR